MHLRCRLFQIEAAVCLKDRSTESVRVQLTNIDLGGLEILDGAKR